MPAMINIPDGNGGTISIPAWAQEETLQKLLTEVRKDRSVSNEVERAVKDIGLDSADFEDALKLLRRHINEASEAESRKSKKIAEDLKKSGKAIAGHLQNTERPLTAMTGILGDVVEGAGGIAGNLFKGSEFAKNFASKIGVAGDMAKVAGTTFMTWLGWNAAKMEQYAEVQQSMIDSGAIVFDTVDAFTTLYDTAQNSGVTYAQFANTTSQFSYGMIGLAKDMSSGTQAFSELISGKNGILKASDMFGDWGMSHDQLMGTYANYIETQVKNGFINNNLHDVKGELNDRFHNLMAETTALANLTGKQRGEYLAKMMESAGDVRESVALSELRKGFPDIADNVEQTLRGMDALIVNAETPQQKQMLENARQALLLEIGNNVGDPSKINVASALVGIDSTQAAILQQTGFLSLLDSTGSGVKVGMDELIGFFKQKNFTKIRENFANLAGNSSDYANAAFELHNLEVTLVKKFRDFDGNFEDEVRKVKSTMPEAGASVVAMNNMTTEFIKVQNAITLDMQSLSGNVKEYTEIMVQASNWIKDVINGNFDEDPNESPDPDSSPWLPPEDSDNIWYKTVFLPALEGKSPFGPTHDSKAEYSLGQQSLVDFMGRDMSTYNFKNDLAASGEEIAEEMLAFFEEQSKTSDAGTAMMTTVNKFGIDAINDATGSDYRVKQQYQKTIDGVTTNVTKEEYDSSRGINVGPRTTAEANLAQRFGEAAGAFNEARTAGVTTDKTSDFQAKLRDIYNEYDIKDLNNDGRKDIRDIRESESLDHTQLNEISARMLEIAKKYRKMIEDEE